MEKKSDNQKQKTNAASLVEEEVKVARSINADYKSKYGFKDDIDNVVDFGNGISEEVVRNISKIKNEPKWMLDIRLDAYRFFKDSKLPEWGANLNEIDFSKIKYFVKATEKRGRTWNEVPSRIKDTFDRLGIAQAERKFLAGVASQYESEVVYHKLKKKWEEAGVIFEDSDTALKKYPEIFKKYFSTVVNYDDNKFAALNTAVWSGGTFIYIPKGVHVDIPLQAYFRINIQNMGQFERTLIVADEDSQVHYIEGCTAPMYTDDSLHSAVVEIICLKNSRVRYTTIQNWSDNVYNLVTKRAVAYENAIMEWIDCNLGSKVTMKYPSVILKEPFSHGEVLSIAVASDAQHQDAGAKIIHMAENTSSVINSKSICKDGGRTTYRGLLKILEGAKNSNASIICDALILDNKSRTDTYPTNDIKEKMSKVGHEASVSRVSEEQLFYLMSRGLSEEEATALIVSGFIEPIVKELPMEYAVELNALIAMSMEGSVG